jgi:hypothetical protein
MPASGASRVSLPLVVGKSNSSEGISAGSIGAEGSYPSDQRREVLGFQAVCELWFAEGNFGPPGLEVDCIGKTGCHFCKLSVTRINNAFETRCPARRPAMRHLGAEREHLVGSSGRQSPTTRL